MPTRLFQFSWWFCRATQDLDGFEVGVNTQMTLSYLRHRDSKFPQFPFVVLYPFHGEQMRIWKK
jgi:hypothetical protein